MGSRACVYSLAVAAALLSAMVAAKPAGAGSLEYHLVRWKKSGKCQVITTLPIFGNHWDEIGVYENKHDADWALSEKQRMRVCPPPDKPKKVAVKPKPKPKPQDRPVEEDFIDNNPVGVW